MPPDIKAKITDEFRAQRARFETRFPAAYHFLVRLEEEGAAHGLVLSTAVNAHLYKGTAFLAYLKLRNPELEPPSLVVSPKYHLRIADEATDRSDLLFPEPLESILAANGGPNATWLTRRIESAFELRPGTPERVFDDVYAAVAALSVR